MKSEEDIENSSQMENAMALYQKAVENIKTSQVVSM